MGKEAENTQEPQFVKMRLSGRVGKWVNKNYISQGAARHVT